MPKSRKHISDTDGRESFAKKLSPQEAFARRVRPLTDFARRLASRHRRTDQGADGGGRKIRRCLPIAA